MAENQEFYRLKLVLTMEDRLTRRLQKVNEIASKFEGEFKKAQVLAEQLGNTKITPEIDIKTSGANDKLDRTNQLLEQISKKVARAKIDVDDRTSGKTTSIQSKLSSLASKTWQVTVALKDDVSSGLGKMKNTLSSPMSVLGMGAATVGVGSFLTNSINKTMDFSAEVSNIKALTGMGDAEISSVRQKALDLGATTQFTSTQAAQGMAELLKAGVNIKDVMGEASQAMLDLAAAGDLELPEAAEIMSTAMNTFHMDNATHAADILAGAANASATSVHELRYSLSMVGNVAAGLGLNFDDTNTALAVFAQNGLKGSDAGTSLKTMLQRLQPDSKPATEAFQQLGLLEADGGSAFYDAAGKMKPIAEVADLLHNSMKDLTSEEQGRLLNDMFGSDAIRGGMILIKEGAEGVKKMNEEMTKFTANAVAKVKWDNAKGDIIRLQSAFENFLIVALAPLEPSIRLISQAFTNLFSNEENINAVTEKMSGISQEITNFVQGLASDEEFQKMDWGDKIVYVLDRIIGTIDDWAGGSGGEQFGKVMTKLAEIGMRAFMTALFGLMKGALNALFSGNIVGAAGLAFGASMLGGGTLIGGAMKTIKGTAKLGSDTLKGSKWLDSAYTGEGGIASKISKKIPIIGGVIDAIRFMRSDDKAKTGSEIAGGWAGALAGGKLGAAIGGSIGAWFGGVGAAPGALIGGLFGSGIGYWKGSNIGGAIVDLLRSDSTNEIKFNMLGVMTQASSPIPQSNFMTMNNGQGTPQSSSFNFSTMFNNNTAQFGVSTTPYIDGKVMMDGLENIKNTVAPKVSEIMETIGQAVENGKNNVNNIFNTLFSEESFSQATQALSNITTYADTKFSELCSSISNWCSQAYSEVVNWFSQIPLRIGKYIDSAVARARAGLNELKTSAWNATPSWLQNGINYIFNTGIGHADGGIFNQEHIARFAEGGKPEAIIPLHSSMRSRGLTLWQQAGELLGVNSQLFANITNNNFTPALASISAVSSSNSSSNNNSASSNSTFAFNGMNINIGNNKSDDEIAIMVGRRILNEIKQSFENRG